MRGFAAIAIIVLPAPALAMNWEGHDDWMAGTGPALLFELSRPDARPLPSPDCPVTADKLTTNPYEQIPLPHHNCPTRPEKAEPER